MIYLRLLLNILTLASILSLSEGLVRAQEDGEARVFSGIAIEKYRLLGLSNEEIEWVRKHPRLTYTSGEKWPPYSFLKDGQWYGIVPAYVDIIREKLDIEITYVGFEGWRGRHEAMANGEIDFFAGVGVSKNNQRPYLYTRPIFYRNSVIYTRTDRVDILNVDDLKGKKLAWIDGGFVRDELKALEPFITKIVVPNARAALLAVHDGRADATLGNSTTTPLNLAQMNITDMKIAAPTGWEDVGVAFATLEDQAMMIGIFNRVFETVPADFGSRATANGIINSPKARLTEYFFSRRDVQLVAFILFATLLTIIAWNRRLKREIGKRREIQRRYRGLMDNGPVAMIELRPDLTIDYMNPAAASLAFDGSSSREWEGSDAVEIFMVDPSGQLRATLKGYIENTARRSFKFDQPVQLITQPDRWIFWNGSIFRDAAGTLTGLQLIGVDATAQVDATEALKQHSWTDPLTGLMNRSAFFEQTDIEIVRAQKLHSDCSLIMLDIDHLVKVNETYGLKAGDEALMHIAAVLRAAAREARYIARVGGEEFVIVAATNHLESLALAERVRAAIEASPMDYDGQQIALTASFGTSKIIVTEDTTDRAFKRAEAAVRKAREKGRNCVVAYRNISAANMPTKP